MSARQIPLILGIIALTAAPAYWLLVRKTPPNDNVPLVSADTQLGPTPPKEVPPPPKLTRTDWEVLVQDALPSVAVIDGKVGHGTGFLLAGQFVVTNAHVVSLEFEENISVQFPSAPKDKRGPYPARRIWTDHKRDLAFLYVDTIGPWIELADTYKLRPAQEVVAIGSPAIGGTDRIDNAVSFGRMSSDARIGGQSFYQLNISVNPGNSGGPVIDSSGKAIGIVSAKLRDKDGIAFAIPLDDLNQGYIEALGRGHDVHPDQAARDRVNTIHGRLAFLFDAYLNGLTTYVQAMDAAVANGQSPNIGLKAASRDIQSQVQTINKVLADAMETNVAATITDQTLPRIERERIRQLWSVCKEMKDLFDQPRGTVESYRQRAQDFERRGRNLISKK